MSVADVASEFSEVADGLRLVSQVDGRWHLEENSRSADATGATKSGEKAASGVYAVVIRADGQEGYAEKKMVKVVLAGE